ncbi:MAG: oligosaccharide flippase family protein [Candidatus Promineifilaceae bacterium]
MIPYIRTQIRRLFTDNTPIIRMFRNAGWLFGGDALTMGIGAVQGILIARFLGADAYGILGLVITYTLFVNQLVDSRVWETVIKFVTQFREQGESAKATAVIKLSYLIDLSTGTVAFALVLLTAPLAASLFIKSGGSTPVIRLFALSVLVAIPRDTSTAVLRVNGCFRWLAIQNSSEAILRFAGILLVLLTKGSITQILVVYLAASTIGTLILLGMVYAIRQEAGIARLTAVPLRTLLPHQREIGSFLLATNLNALLKMVRNSDILLLGYLFVPAQVGYYRIARQFAQFINLPVNPIYSASFPEFATLWHQKEMQILKRAIKRVVQLASAIALTGGAVLFLFGKWILVLAVTDAYLPALPVLRWLAAGTAVAVATSSLRPLLLAAGKANKLTTASIAGIAAQFTLIIILAPKWHIAAAGAGYLAFYLVWIAICLLSFWQAWQTQQKEGHEPD